jgi:hypothetical protein
MKLLAIHDTQGHIARLLIRPPDAPPVAVATGPGQLATEIDAPDVRVDPANPDSYQRLLEVLQHYRVESKTEGKLVKKPRPKAR